MSSASCRPATRSSDLSAVLTERNGEWSNHASTWNRKILAACRKAAQPTSETEVTADAELTIEAIPAS